MNESGWILVKATRVGSETALSQIVQLVEAAQLARAPVQKIADRISRFFVPTVSFLLFSLHFICFFSVVCVDHLDKHAFVGRKFNGDKSIWPNFCSCFPPSRL